MNNYCSNCGHKAESKGSVVNFCPKCGQDLRSLELKASSKGVDETSQGGALNISALKDKIKINVEKDKSSKITLADIVQEVKASKAPPEVPLKRRTSTSSGKKLLKEIREGCSSSREKSSELK